MDSLPSHRSQLVRQPAAGSANTSPDDAYEVVQHPQSKLLELTTRMLHLSALPDDSLDRPDTGSQEPSCVRWLLSRGVLEHIPGDGSVACSALATSAGIPEEQLSDVVGAAILCGFLREPVAGHVAHTRSSASLVFCKSFLRWLRGTSSVPMPILLEVLSATLAGEAGDGDKPATSDTALGATGSFPNGVRHDGSLAAASSDDPANVATTLPNKSQKPPAEHLDGVSSQVQPPLAPASDERPVLIIGAGISGLCLAQALRKVGIPFKVFERDSAIDSRPQGYRLKLRQDAEVALAESLPQDVYQHFLASCAILAVGETDFNPFTGEVTKSRAGGGLSGKLGLNPSHTVDRTVFRSILMTGIEDRVFFSRQLASYTANEDQGGGGGGGVGVVVTFTDGERAEGRFLVGADGLHSVVRPGLLPGHRIKDTGAACVYGKTPLTPELAARFPEKGLRWMTVVADQAPMLQSFHIGDAPATLLTEPTRFSEESRARYRLPQDYVYWVLIAPQTRFGAGGGLTSSPPPKAGNNTGPNQQQQQTAAAAAAEAAARLSLAVTEEWHPSLRSVFELQDTRQATFVPIISSVPDIPAWEPSAVVTLLGDAIHPMSPCGGVGAQTAICDAAALAKVLDEARGSPSAGDVGSFEEGMRRRARGSIAQSEIGSKTMFGLGSLEECKPWASN